MPIEEEFDPARTERIARLYYSAENGYKRNSAGRIKEPVEIQVSELLDEIAHLERKSIFVRDEQGKVWRLDETCFARDGLWGLVSIKNVRVGMALRVYVQSEGFTETFPLAPEASHEHAEMADLFDGPSVKA